jgi:hypothetical protein
MNHSLDWASWITAIGTGAGTVGVLIVAVLKSFFVTHAQMREYYKERDEERLRMHNENKADMREVKTDVSDIKETLSRLEGQLCGRYPRINQ